MSDGVEIRIADLANPDDGVALVEIIDSYARGPGGQNAPLSEEAKQAMPGGLHRHPLATVFFACVDGRPVGAAVCVESFGTFAGRPSLNIHDFAVLPKHQGQGAGGELLRAVEAYAREQGCSKITLEVHSTNVDAQRLYRRFGFGPWDEPTLFVTRPLGPA